MTASPLRRVAPAAGLMILFAAGCGDGLGLTTVSGTVTLDGKPVPNAIVTFTPQGAGGSPSYGTTDANGVYELRFSRDRDGVLPGTHDVTIAVEKISKEDAEAMKAEGQEVPEFVRVPPKYGRSGAIVQEVGPDGGTIDLALTSK